MITSNTIALIKKHEGLRLKPYHDTVGKLTIGIGRNLDDCGISETEAEMMLQNDLTQAENDIRSIITNFDDLNEVRQAVLIDMIFNMGKSRFLEFRYFIAAVNKGDFSEAEAQMIDSAWANQVPSRAHELAAIMLKGEWL